MKLEWLILAEGVARDADGALTVVGLNQNVLLAAVVPTVTKRAVIAHLSGLQTGEEISFSIRFEGPTGEVLTANAGQAKLEGEPPWAGQNVEAAFDVPAEVQIPIRERGRHRFVVTVDSSTGEHAEQEVALYVVEPPQPPGPSNGGS